MPFNATLCNFYIGQTPPPNPSPTTVWRSTSLADARVASDLRDRQPILTPNGVTSGTFREDNALFEPNAYYDANSNTWNLFYTAAPYTSPRMSYAQSTNGPKGPYTRIGTYLGQGTNGEPGIVQHPGVYVEGGIVYFNYDIGAGQLRYTSATIQANGRPTNPITPTTIATTPTGVTGFGNSQIFKRNPNDYVMVVDFSSAIQFQVGLYTATSLAGPWTLLTVQVKGLSSYTPNPNVNSGQILIPNDQMTNLTIFREGNKFIAFYHNGPRNIGGANISDAWRATTNDSTLMTGWVPDPVPLIRRMHTLEVDQLADLYVTQGGPPSTTDLFWVFWDGDNNQTLAGNIFCAPLLPVDKMYDGAQWQVVREPTVDWNRAEFFNLTETKNTNYTAAYQDEVPFDTTSASYTCTLPLATFGARVRVINTGPNAGANTVTIALSGSDTCPNAGSALTVGQAATYRCYKPAVWSRAG